MDPFSAIAELILGKLKQNAFNAWIRLLFQMVLSAVVSFLVTCSSVGLTTLSLTKSPGIAMVSGILSGMGMAGIVLTVWFRKSILTKGMMLILPASEALKEIQTDLQTIQK